MWESRWGARIKASSAPGATLASRRKDRYLCCCCTGRTWILPSQQQGLHNNRQPVSQNVLPAVRRIPRAQPAASFAYAFSSAGSLAQTSSFSTCIPTPSSLVASGGTRTTCCPCLPWHCCQWKFLNCTDGHPASPPETITAPGGRPRPCIMWLSLPPWNHLPSLLKSNPNVWPCSLNCHITTSGTSGYGAVVYVGNTSLKTLASLSCLLLLQSPYPAHTSKTALNSQYQYSHTLLPDKTPWRQGPSHDTHPGVLGPGPAVDLPHTFVTPVPTVMTALCDSVHWVAIYSISHFYILMGETNKMKSEHNYKLYQVLWKKQTGVK